MSAGMRGGMDTEPLKMLSIDPDQVNEQIDLLWIACGRDDFAFDGASAFSDHLKEIGIKHTFYESAGEHHWRVWRHYLRDVAPLLFK